MRLSDLLHTDVFDADGVRLGHVRDVRLVQDGPMLAETVHALRVDALVVGRGALGVRLGYHRKDMKGPWPLRVVFRALERRTKLVPWESIESWEGEAIRLGVRAAELGPVPIGTGL